MTLRQDIDESGDGGLCDRRRHGQGGRRLYGDLRHAQLQAPGETAKTVTVTVLDDAHDEGAETLMLRLSNAAGARIADGAATGTIKNTDPMPQAWLARFGRTVGTHVTDAISTRLRAGPEASSLTIGGQPVPLKQAQADAADASDDGSFRQLHPP